MVDIFSLEEGVVTAGDQYTLQCSIHREATAPNGTLLEMTWLDRENDVISSEVSYILSGTSATTADSLTSTLTFPRLTTSQGGWYSCVINVTIPGKFKDLQVITSSLVRVASEY